MYIYIYMTHHFNIYDPPSINIYDPPSIRSGGSVKKVLYNRVYISTIFITLIYTFIPL